MHEDLFNMQIVSKVNFMTAIKLMYYLKQNPGIDKNNYFEIFGLRARKLLEPETDESLTDDDL